MGTFKVLVCGGRDYDNWDELSDELQMILWKLEPRTDHLTIITGDACGADWLARAWAKSMAIDYNVGYEPYPADWKRYGKVAGPIRNQKMLDEGKPDLVLAFPGGSGTKDMVTRARNAGVEVREVYW